MSSDFSLFYLFTVSEMKTLTGITISNENLVFAIDEFENENLFSNQASGKVIENINIVEPLEGKILRKIDWSYTELIHWKFIIY